MFLGEYNHSLDTKGRLIVPSKFREDLGDRCVVTKGLDGCLFVFPLQEWQVLSEKLRSLPLTQKDARAFVRFFFAGASEVECDKQGRIMIPQPLKDHAALDKGVMVIGVANRLELWAETRWYAYQDQEDASFEQLAELMNQFDVTI